MKLKHDNYALTYFTIIYYRFTATWPREIQTIAREFLRSPIEIKFGDSNNLNANKAITQIIRVVNEGSKPD